MVLIATLTGCSKAQTAEIEVLQTEKNKLQSEYDLLEEKFLQLDYEYMQEEKPLSSEDADYDIKILLATLGIENDYFGGYIADDVLQINIIAEQSAYRELQDMADILEEGYYVIDLWRRTAGFNYLYLRVADIDGIEMFEFYYDFSEGVEAIIEISVGMKYFEDIGGGL